MKPSIKALIYSRVSSTKQRQKGESPEKQIKECIRKAKDLGYKEYEMKTFDPESFSGKSASRPVLDEVFEFVENNSSVECVIFKCIDRLSRTNKAHQEIKERLASFDVKIIDADGLIQPSRNILESFEESIGAKLRSYDWADESPSDMAEVLASQVAEEERKRILKRTIPREMELATQGAIVRSAGYGYKNAKLPHPISRKVLPSQVIIPEEAAFISRAFELKAQDWSSRDIVDELNNMGYQSRKVQKWNKEKTHVVGYSGQTRMDTKKLNYWLANVTHAGFIKENWTGNNPVKAIHQPIVSLKTWNKANKNSRHLVADSKAVYGWRLDEFKYSEKKRNYSLNNPDFPFKELVRCHVCSKNLKGSSSRGKSGQYFPSYHCSRGHGRVSIKPTDLNENISKSLEGLVFSDSAAEILEITLKELWTVKLEDINSRSIQAEEEVSLLEKKADETLTTMASLDSLVTIKAMEKRYVNLQDEIEELNTIKDNKKYTERDVTKILKHARYFVEHLDTLVLESNDRAIRNGFWSLIYPKTPTLEALQNGTPQTSPIMELKSVFENQNAGWQAQ